MRVRLGTGVMLLAGLVAVPADAAAQTAEPPPQPQSSVTITAPQQVAPGKSFTVNTKITLSGPDPAFVTGGFMDFYKTRLATHRTRCPATPAGTFAGDTPQMPQPPSFIESSTPARNAVKHTGMLRFCIWVINATTGEQDSAAGAYIKAVAPKKGASRRVAAAALQGNYKGHASPKRHPIRLKISNRKIHDLTYSADFRCSDGLTVGWTTRVAPFAIGAGGSFKANPVPFVTQNDAVAIQGRVRSGKVTGSFSEVYTSVLGNTCRSGKVRFTATRPRPKPRR